MVSLYPHTVILTTVSESTQDGEGNYVPGSPSSTTIKGRYEPNRKGAFINAADGKQIVYSGMIYTSLSAPDIALGTEVEVKEGTVSKAKGNVIQFNRGQLNVVVMI